MVTSTGVPVAVDRQTRAVSVLTHDDLERRPARTTPDALLEAEGVFLVQDTAAGGAPIVRGLSGSRVLLLVDGVRLNNGTVGPGAGALLGTVDPFLVELVEVLRGPGSVLYGSDALGGVVDVRTDWPRFATGEATPSARLEALGGSADLSLQGHLHTGLALADTAVSAALTARDFNDLRGGALVGVQPYTGYEEGDAALKLRQRLGSRTQLFFQYQSVRQRNAARPDLSVPGTLVRATRQERDFLHGRLESTALSFASRASLELSAQQA